MLIRKNTKAFKTIVQIITTCQERPDREKLVRLYITRAGTSIKERISTDAIQGDAEVFYEMNYQSILVNLNSPGHQLQVSDDVPGIYFFHSSGNKVWDETPFEFDDAIKKEFSDLPELPVTRKKEKTEKYELPKASTTAKKTTGKSKVAAAKKEKPGKEKEFKAKMVVLRDTGPKQPDYKLQHAIHFTNMDRVISRQPQLTRKDIFDYYHQVADRILPYLKDRALTLRIYTDHVSTDEYRTRDELDETVAEIPDWMKTAKASRTDDLLVCNDKEHLLLFNEMGCHAFNTALARTKSPDTPDYFVIIVDSPEHDIAKAVPATLTAKQVLDGLKLPSFILSNGRSSLHIYIPLDAKSTFESAYDAARFICKLVALKIPDAVTLGETEEYAYGKVSLDFSINDPSKSLLAPYSLVPGPSTTVATPLLWEELTDDLQLDAFNHETIFKRLKQVGDPFETLFKKKVNAEALLERLEENYGFLTSPSARSEKAVARARYPR